MAGAAVGGDRHSACGHLRGPADLQPVPSGAGQVAPAILRTDVARRLRQLVLDREHAVACRALAACGTLRRRTRAAWPRGDRWRGRHRAGRCRGGRPRRHAFRRAKRSRHHPDGHRGHDRGRAVDRRRRRAPPLPRGERDDLQPAHVLHCNRHHEPSGRGATARSRLAQQALDRDAGRRPADRKHSGYGCSLGPCHWRHRLHPRLGPDREDALGLQRADRGGATCGRPRSRAFPLAR